MNHISLVDFVSIKPFDPFVRSEPNKQNKTSTPSTMSTAFPLHTPVNHTPRKRTNIVVNGCEPSNPLQTLSSETAQRILKTLSEEPGTVSDIAETVETSLQNVQYHLTRLSEAGLVEAVDTWYSEKGREMTVYALTAEELVIQFENDR